MGGKGGGATGVFIQSTLSAYSRCAELGNTYTKLVVLC